MLELYLKLKASGLSNQSRKFNAVCVISSLCYILHHCQELLSHNEREIRDFLAILGRGPRAFLIGKFSDVTPEFGKL